MIQLPSSVHLKTIVGLITILILFNPLIFCFPTNQTDTQQGSDSNFFPSKNETENTKSKGSGRFMNVAIAPPKDFSNASTTTVREQNDNLIDPLKPNEEETGQKGRRNIEFDEIEDKKVPPLEIDPNFVSPFLMAMNQYEIRINPVVSQYNESTYKVELLATLVRKSGNELPTKLPTIETIVKNEPEGELVTFDGSALNNTLNSTRPSSENSVNDETSFELSGNNNTLPNKTDHGNGSLSADYALGIGSESTSITLDKQRDVKPDASLPSTGQVTSSSGPPKDLSSKNSSETESNSPDKKPKEKTEPVSGSTPSICERQKLEAQNSAPKSDEIVSTMKSNTPILVASTASRMTSPSIKQTSPISPSSNVASTTPVPISRGTTDQPPRPTNKLDSPHDSNASIDKVNEIISLWNPEYARPAPETEWTPENVLVGPPYLLPHLPNPRLNYVETSNNRDTRNNQVQPSRPVNQPISRQEERPKYQGDPRQVNAPPPVVSFKPPPPPPPSAPARPTYNQENHNVVGTRGSNQHPALDPGRRVNPGPAQNRGQNLDQRGAKPQHEPAPALIEEIVETRGSRLNQNQIEPALFMKVIRHYFGNALAPREDRFVFERREPIMQPQARPLNVINRNQYQT